MSDPAVRALDEAKADHAFAVALGHAVSLGGRDGLSRLKCYTAKIAAAESTLGRDPAAVALQHGLGLIPDSVLANYAAEADILAALFDRNGELLWLGRLERYANPTQMIALTLRDRGCVLCGADPLVCQAHHSMPWGAPGQGRTDLDDLVLLCGPRHTQLHAETRSIYRDSSGVWRTRPATPDETPPARPNTTRNTVRRE